MSEHATERGWSDEETRLRKGICEIGRLAYAKGYIVGADGNISARMSDGTILITPAGAMKGFLEPHHVAHIDLRGDVLDGGPKASTEKSIHIVVYEERPEMKAMVHAHPPHAVAMSIAGFDLQQPFIPEIIVTIGGIPTAPFGTPGTAELPESIRSIVLFNPLTPIFVELRKAVFDPAAPSMVAEAGSVPQALAPVALGVCICAFSVWYFVREAPSVAEAL